MKKLKEINKNFTKSNQKGITLIALIVTIIVLIIIAGISIATLTADNGVLRQTNLAKVQQMEANAREQVSLACAAMRVAIAEAHAQDNSYSAKGNISSITNKLLDVIKKDTVQLEQLSWSAEVINSDNGTLQVKYAGGDYKQVCNNNDAEIIFEITLGQKSIEITDETNSTLKDQNGNNVELDIGAENGSGGAGSEDGSGETEEPDTPTETDLATVASIGQYVNYDPTDVSAENAGKTSYTSVAGSTTVSGNGSGSQTFSASNYKTHGGKWQILDIDTNGTITLISDLIYQDSGTGMGTTGLTLTNGIGYLWGEKELNTICAIYGYGKGADTTQTITYYYGGPNDQNGSITAGTVEAQQGRKATMDLDSGARSLKMSDINKIAGTEKTYTVNYSSKTVAKDATTNAKYYPTLNTTNTTTGVSTAQSSATGNFYDTYYYYSDIASSNTAQNEMINLDGTVYWVSTRAMYPMTDSIMLYYVLTGNLAKNNIVDSCLQWSSLTNIVKGNTPNHPVRAVVTLENGIKTSDATYDSTTGWNFAD